MRICHLIFYAIQKILYKIQLLQLVDKKNYFMGEDMSQYGFAFPAEPRKTVLTELEDKWYAELLAEKRGVLVQPIKRSNFGQYMMAVNYTTSILEEARAIHKVAIYNIDHMAQVRFWGKDAAALLHRTVGANILEMKTGQCKYTLLLNESGGVQDDMIFMRVSDTEFIMVINAGHDLTGTGSEDGVPVEYISDVDRIMKHKRAEEEVFCQDISDDLVKIDIQGPLSFKLIKQIYGAEVLKNRNSPDKNMNFFTFNEFDRKGEHYFISRTGYTNRWGWELYIPASLALEDFKTIVETAVDMGGLLVGLGGRDENRISAGAFGLPLMGQEYDPTHTPVNAPLFEAAIDMNKGDFIGRTALQAQISAGCTKKMAIIITEGIVSHRGVYLQDKRIGSVTSSINSPNVSLDQRLAIGSKRKNVNEEHGAAAIGLAWLYNNPFETDAEGKDITHHDDKPLRIMLEFYRENENQEKQGTPVLGYITTEGITPATAPKALKNIENL